MNQADSLPTTDAAATGWGGSPFTLSQVAAAMLIGTVGVTIAGIQPILYGALLEAGRINMAQIGQAATLELLALGIGVVLGGALMKGARMRPMVVLAALLLAAANLATLRVSGDMVPLVRGLAGLPGGAMVWVMTATIVRSARPATLAAASLLTQALVQSSVAATVAFLAHGAVGGVPIAISLLSLVAIAVTPLLPRAFAPLPREPTVSGLPPLRGWAVLAATLLLQAAIVGAWVYMEPVGRQAGLTDAQIAFATPASLASQIVGGTIAILLSSRVRWFPALILAASGLVLLMLGMSRMPAPTMFIAMEMGFGALWTFSSPFLTPFSIENDPTRRTAMLGPSAMLIGSGLGPIVASALAAGGDGVLVLRMSALFAVGTMLLITGLFLTRRKMGGARISHA
ncbi:hypothetical protein L6Q21_10345 [Sandaracinobacter sp. RS1-74]|uniref:hypothetical protein n=1 Tax=Sandaracinobacteroides sayramensis TaxID=2913411 RepID=UPI001EDB172C|nr:hypothetical protein [Sandaracinobacteroides sayramensis]MCG2841380.1 hypothetical protein [Sandaracinobacteroides sayramensis]